MLIDGGRTHNFIDAAWVAKRGIQTEEFEVFTVAVEGNNSMEYNHWIPKLNVTLGNYNMTNSFYVINVADTNVVLGVQWLYSIGKYTTYYRTMEMEFQRQDGKKGGLEGHEHLSPQAIIITKDGGRTQTGIHRVVIRMFCHFSEASK